ncbi:cytochrome P450 [Dactylonectria estremocensis]|uniref:Cytochrome P450 n=1 Tax=Dactylonectria estremocensis TaxID=1079267 RepID=A0A9P9DQH3_9HYPO|nr:cytochrome P450 [Dactylonectria estremocensis]
MAFLIIEVPVLMAMTVFLGYYFFLLPPKYPQNIPAIPFWVALIPFFKDVDQSDIFKRYIDAPLRKHGAVKIFFGAQWNVLVHRPSYVVEMFKDEDLFEKSGNQKKIPHSVLAQFLGDNIISAHGDNWKTYQGVIKPGLQRNFDGSIVVANAHKLTKLLRDAQGAAGDKGIPMQDYLQRYSVANCSEGVLQTQFHPLESPTAPINVMQSQVKMQIFKPIFMNFPVLDRFPFPSRVRARQVVQKFKHELKRALIESHEKVSPHSEGLGRRMLDAAESGVLSEQQLLDNLTVAFVAGQENPQLAMTSMLYLLAKNPEAQATIYKEIIAHGAQSADQTKLGEMPYLTSVIYECLRLFPPIGQLINRRASRDVFLGGDEVLIPEGTYMGYHSYSTNRDPEAWGASADDFDPSRWGKTPEQVQTHYRKRRARGEFISFHGGRRACLGERFALLQLRTTLVVLIQAFEWTLDPTWVDRKTPAGPLYPRALRLVFAERSPLGDE